MSTTSKPLTLQQLCAALSDKNGSRDIFCADVQRGEETGRIVISASSLQSAGSLLKMYAQAGNFTVLGLS